MQIVVEQNIKEQDDGGLKASVMSYRESEKFVIVVDFDDILISEGEEGAEI